MAKQIDTVTVEGTADNDSISLLSNGHQEIADNLNSYGIDLLCHLTSPPVPARRRRRSVLP